MARALGETHRQCTGYVNARARWTGHLFQGRYASVALDEAHLIAAARTIALKAVRARLTAQAQDWARSSARAHAAARDDGLVSVAPLIERVGRGTELIGVEPEPALLVRLRAVETIGRPLGGDDFVAALERRLGRALRPRKRGRKPRTTLPDGQFEREIGD